jgi:hypothetical protein
MAIGARIAHDLCLSLSRGKPKKEKDMHRKLFMLIAALLLVLTTSVAPMKVAAQGLTEVAIFLWAVVGIGTEQKLELYWWSQRPSPPDQIPTDRIFFNYHLFSSAVAPGGPICPSQTVQATVTPTPDLNITNVSRDGDHLVINGEEVGDPLSDCLRDAKRVVLTLSEIIDGQAPVVPPDEPRLGLPNVVNRGNIMMGYYAIVDSNDATVATGVGVNVFGGGLALYD